MPQTLTEVFASIAANAATRADTQATNLVFGVAPPGGTILSSNLYMITPGDDLTIPRINENNRRLSNSIITEKGRVDAILSASTANADSFKEIVDIINSVDLTNDTAFAGYVSSNNLAVSNIVDGTTPVAKAGTWTTARTLTLSGDVSGSATFNGSGAIALVTTVAKAAAWTTARTLSLAGDLTGSVSINGSSNVILTGTVAKAATWTTPRTISISGGATGSAVIDGSIDKSIAITITNDSHTHDTRYYTKTEITAGTDISVANISALII